MLIMYKNIPQTEQLYQKSKPIDKLCISNAISLMIKEQKNVRNADDGSQPNQ